MRLRTLLLCLAPVAVLAACAGDGPPPDPMDGRPPDVSDGRAGERPGGGRAAMLALFISPAGKPFRGAPNGTEPAAAWFAQADTDHDGKLTLAEFTADAERFFQQLDKDANGVIDGFEAQDYERNVAPELLPQIGRLRAGEGQDDRLFKPDRGGRGGGRGGGMGRGGMGGSGGDRPPGSSRGAGPSGAGSGAYQLFPDPEPITSADADLNGKVTLAEWRSKAKRVFKQLDDKGVGYLTFATLPKTPQQLALEKRRATEEKRRPR